MMPQSQGMATRPSDTNLDMLRRSNTSDVAPSYPREYGQASRRMSMQVSPNRSNQLPRTSAPTSNDTRIDHLALDPPGRARPIDLQSLSNRMGVPRGQSSKTSRPSSKPKHPNENVIDWSTRSEMTNDRKSFRRTSRRNSNFSNERMRSNSLDNLPEDGPVTGTLPQRNTDPNLASVDFGDPNLFDEVLVDLFACVAKGSGEANPPQQQQQQQLQQQQQQQQHQKIQRRNSAMVPRNTKSNESLASLARMTSRNESFNSLSKHSSKASSRGSMRRNSNWELVKSQVNNPQRNTLPASQFGNSRSHENLDHVFQQRQTRRNSVVKPNRSHGNLGVFEQQQQQQQEQGGSAKGKEGSTDMMQMLKIATKMKMAMNQAQNPQEQDRIQRNYAAQLAELRQKHDEERRLSNDAQRRQSDGSKRSSLSNSGISNLTGSGDSGDEKRLSNASGRSGGSSELRLRSSNISGDGGEVNPSMVMAEIVPANVPSRQRRRRSIAKSIKGMQKRRNSKIEIQGLPTNRNSNFDLHRMGTRKVSNVDFQAISNDYANEPLVPLGLKPTRRDSRASLGSGMELTTSKRASRGNSGDGHKLKLFDDMMNVSEPKLDNSNKSKNDEAKNQFNKHNIDRKDQPETDQKKIKLYDEILSASNTDRQSKGPKTAAQDGTASTMQTFQSLPLLDHSMKSLRSFGSKSKKKATRCGRCRKKDKKLMLGLVFLLLGLIGGYLIFSFMPGLQNNSNVDSRTEEVGEEPFVEVITNPTSPADNSTVIAPPPPDIEGMCSASNLPGSLSACLAACLPSACCYSGFSGSSCVEENQPESKASCASYRPYCDIFYDEEVWIDGTEGVLRYITDEKLKMCSGIGSSVISEPSSSSSFASPSSGVKRLRGRTILNQSVIDDERNLLELAPQETCENYCISARCCSAPIITNQELSGVILSATGVYTNATTGEYVMTNCQKSNSMNVQLCSRYETFCSKDDSQPIASGVYMSSLNPSTKPIEFPRTASPTLKPTSFSESPAKVPVPWPSNEYSPNVAPPFASNAPFSLNPSSSSPVSIEGSKGPTSKLTQASYQPNLSTPASINDTNVATHSSSNPSKPPTTSSESLAPIQSASSVATNSSNVSIKIPPAPSGDIEKACTDNKATFLIATGDPQARKACVKACQDGLCCFSTQLKYDWIEPCYAGNEQICTEYAPCLILQGEEANSTSNETVPSENIIVTTNATASNITNATTVEENKFTESLEQSANSSNSTNTTNGPPIPDADLSILCSEESIAQTEGLKKCINACDLGRCCSSSDNATGCFSTHTETCYLYTPCNNAYNIFYSD